MRPTLRHDMEHVVHQRSFEPLWLTGCGCCHHERKFCNDKFETRRGTDLRHEPEDVVQQGGYEALDLVQAVLIVGVDEGARRHDRVYTHLQLGACSTHLIVFGRLSRRIAGTMRAASGPLSSVPEPHPAPTASAKEIPLTKRLPGGKMQAGLTTRSQRMRP